MSSPSTRDADPATMPAATTNEVTLWKWVEEQPRPPYPRSSLQAGRGGIAVAGLRISIDGSVARIDVLEAPDAEIRESFVAALRQWTFSWPDQLRKKERKFQLESKITLYFVPDGDGLVLSAEEMRQRNSDDVPSSSPGGNDLKADSAEVLIQEIDESSLSGLLAESDPVLVDLRERLSFQRGHRPGAINIPLEELLARGPAELPQGRPVVLDCSHGEIIPRFCRAFARSYGELAGIRHLTLLVPGHR